MQPPLPTLERWTLAVARGFKECQLEPTDFYFGEESVLLLQGYPVQPPPGWERRFSIHVAAPKLQMGPGDTAPPAGTPAHAVCQRLVQEEQVPLSLVPLTRYAIPLTFRKKVTLEGMTMDVASPRALARIRLTNTLEALQRAEPDGLAALRADVPWVAALGAVAWPTRDGWFGTFCQELATMVESFIGEPARLTSKLERLGRRFAML
jgi:hypothetical protein